VRKQFARHLGGTNLGFADGHASWFDSERLLVEFVNSAKGERSAINSDYMYAGCMPHFPAYCGSDADCCPQLPSIWPQ
jgi:prepilin-type processing-associated H-X9-DG protein